MDLDTRPWPPRSDDILEDLGISPRGSSICDLLGMAERTAPMTPPPPPDPRTPILRLLEAFDLPEERELRAAIVHWNESPVRFMMRRRARGAWPRGHEGRRWRRSPGYPTSSGWPRKRSARRRR